MKVNIHNISIILYIILCFSIKNIYSLSECTVDSNNICTLTKGLKLLNQGKYCIVGSKIYYGNNSTGGCALATTISKKGYYFFKNNEIITNADSDPDSGYNCVNNSLCTIIEENGIYINELSKSNVVSYVKNGSSVSIAITKNCSFLTKLEFPLLINCDLINGCSTKNYASINDVFINGLGNGLNKALIICSDSDQCKTITPEINTYYTSSTDKDGLIECNKEGCKSLDFSLVTKNSYYINDGNNKDYKQLIYCNDQNSKCETIKGIKNFLINEADKTTLIECTTNKETNEMKCSIIEGKENYFYLNGAVTDSLDDALIQCDSEKCSYYTPTTGYYLNGKVSDLSNALIYCSTSSCSVTEGKDNLYYINNAGDELKKGLIYCNNIDLCSTIDSTQDSFYLSGIMDGLDNALIYWDNNSVPYILNGITDSYYINAATTNSTNALINCDTNGCSTISGFADSYYITKTYEKSTSNKPIFKTLIYCNNKQFCENVTGEINSYYLNRVATGLDESLIFCDAISSSIVCSSVLPAKINPGYYINSGKMANLYPLITCDDYKCRTHKIKTEISPGFYINAGDSSNVIIICGDKCYSTNVLNLQELGGYIYKDSVLGFYYNNTVTFGSTTSTSIDYFYNVKIPNGNTFPTVTDEKETVFKVSKYSITRVVVDGILSIGTNNQLTSDEIKFGISQNKVFSCNSDSMTCTLINSCITNGFYLDKLSNVGYYCDSNQLTPLSHEGYYIDSSRLVGNNTPYLIYCNVLNECMPVDNPNYYYLNAGVNYMPKAQLTSSSTLKNEKNLIYCNSKNCNTLVSTTGYYVAGISSVDTVTNRLIYCMDNSCNNPRPISNYAYFINNGVDNNLKPLILCDKNICSTQAFKSGYFLAENKNKLISCDGLSCKEINASSGYYHYGGPQISTKYIIQCENQLSSELECELKEGQPGFYVSNISNVLINCNKSQCQSFTAKNGIFRSATTTKSSSSFITKRDLVTVNRFQKRDKSIDIYNLIICDEDGCHELSSTELSQVPICTYSNDKCYIDLPTSSVNMNKFTSIYAGGYCTSSDRSQIYFATNNIDIKNKSTENEDSLSIVTKTTNCIEVGKKYSNNYFVYGNIIYKLDEASIFELRDPGYYFINTNTNTLASSIDISSYNDINTKLFKCTENGCSTVKRPENTVYYTDINKKIIKYDISTDKYFFMKDIICIYNNEKCTPNSNMNNQNICITYKGELVLTSSEINSYESGTCYKASDISTSIYGYSNNLYFMDSNSAQLIQNTSYFFINSNTHTNVNYKDFINGKNNSILIYGCLMSNCDIYEPEEGLYYYNSVGNYLIKYVDGVWTTPKTSGYALVSVNPNEVFIYKFSIVSGNVILENKVSDGFYYTIDEEMYICTENNHTCDKISETGYYYTPSDEMYYCLYDSEHVEKTECYKQSCTTGQYYFIEDKYHRCEKSSIFHPVEPIYCSPFDKVIINFPIMYKDVFPNYIRKAIDNVELHNNSTSVIKSNSINYMSVVPGIFTNCRYNYEDDTTTFDLICISNYVEENSDKNVKICSIEKLGYTKCEEDKENPEKCNVSFALPNIKFHKILYTFVIISITYLLFI
ncbi:scaffoldin [Anaeromyces robustus]|uniref:Scaffoldin n=1 Tax=Anaeromyces robustus TaxID=1754192 RepID=A0A1Y1XP71_9FUNG|nr:scaffoldin [Anaeromyces robustus]|eukprot:ORX87465.1 scaffoldin [Anaeromyces robustus]